MDFGLKSLVIQVLVHNNNNNFFNSHKGIIKKFYNVNIINFLNNLVNLYNIYIKFNKKLRLELAFTI